jgi:hypothetical protein
MSNNDKKVTVALSVVQWNVIISSIKTLTFYETEEILKAIGEQTANSEAKGHDELKITLFANQVNQLISFLQFMPYNVVARIIYTLYSSLKVEDEPQEGEVQVSVEE